MADDRLVDWDNDALEIGRLYPAVYHRFHTSKQVIPGSGVTPRMLGLLQHLSNSGPLTLSELAEFLGLSKSAVTELVDRVEAKNLISRIRDDRDRRKVFIGLTDEGEKIAQMSTEVLEGQKLAQALSKMETEDIKGLIYGLRALLKAEKGEYHE